MTTEDELKLQGDKVVELLNELSSIKKYVAEDLKNFGLANTLGRAAEMIKALHIINVETIKENIAVTDGARLHFAGQAMQGLIQRYANYHNIVVEAFEIADNMVNYGKQESQVNETASESNALEPDSNNNEQ